MAGETIGRRLSRALARTIATRTARSRNTSPFVSFTFDDFHATAATTGAALLERHGARGTFYTSGSLLGTVEPDRRAADVADYVALHRRGHEIGCHTFGHALVSDYKPAALAADIARNQACIGLAGEPIPLTNFAYPYNSTSLRAKRQLERRFHTCRGGVPGINVGRVDLGFLRAVELHDAGIDAGQVQAWVDRAVRQVGWLIFFTHGVREEEEPWRCTPGLLDTAITMALRAGCEVLTVEAAARRMGLVSG